MFFSLDFVDFYAGLSAARRGLCHLAASLHLGYEMLGLPM
jgi:hypothetical protein